MEEGDTIEIDIPHRRIHLAVEKSVLAARRKAMEAKGDAAWKPALEAELSRCALFLGLEAGAFGWRAQRR